ncbi:MAG: DUF1501 domain-containing protein, partial [Chitinophagales bacterium]
MRKVLNRREFIQMAGLASTSFFIPGFLKAASNSNLSAKPKVLVVIQLSGGNDGLNCIIPYRNDLYYQLRPHIGYRKNELIALSDDVGLNLQMSGIADLFYNGDVVMINNVGYPNPNRSHFRSMDIWQSGSDADNYWQTGWLGRALDAQCTPGKIIKPHAAIEIDDSLSLALKGENVSGFATSNMEILRGALENPLMHQLAEKGNGEHGDSQVAYLYKQLAATSESANYIYAQSKIYHTQTDYPDTPLGRQLKMIAELIISETHTSIYYISHSGFDTHALQRGQHERQLRQYSDAVKIFCDDLKAHHRFSDILIMTFSEFGRRP